MSLLLAKIAQLHRSIPVSGISSQYVRLTMPLLIAGSDGYISLQRIRFKKAGSVISYSTYPTRTTNQSSAYAESYTAAAAYTSAAPAAGAVSNGWTCPGSNRYVVPQWLSIDFKTPVTFDSVEVYPDGIQDRNPATIQVQTSADGVSWVTQWTRTSLTYPTNTWYPINAGTS